MKVARIYLRVSAELRIAMLLASMKGA